MPIPFADLVSMDLIFGLNLRERKLWAPCACCRTGTAVLYNFCPLMFLLLSWLSACSATEHATMAQICQNYEWGKIMAMPGF